MRVCGVVSPQPAVKGLPDQRGGQALPQSADPLAPDRLGEGLKPQIGSQHRLLLLLFDFSPNQHPTSTDIK